MLHQSYLKEKTSQNTQFEITLFSSPNSTWRVILAYEALYQRILFKLEFWHEIVQVKNHSQVG